MDTLEKQVITALGKGPMGIPSIFKEIGADYSYASLCQRLMMMAQEKKIVRESRGIYRLPHDNKR